MPGRAGHAPLQYPPRDTVSGSAAPSLGGPSLPLQDSPANWYTQIGMYNFGES